MAGLVEAIEDAFFAEISGTEDWLVRGTADELDRRSSISKRVLYMYSAVVFSEKERVWFGNL